LFTAYGSLVQLFKHKNDGNFYETTKNTKVVGWYAELIGGFNPFGKY